MILLVDDSSVQRSSLRASLESAGYQVREAGSAEEAWPLIEHDCPCVLVIDLIMPDTSGAELLERVINQVRARGAKAIVTTAMPDPLPPLPPDALVIRKPFKVPVLLDAIRKLMPPEGPQQEK